jgi:uncharacterized protein (DUF111 family)
VWAGPAPYEMCTPTGAALLAATVTAWGPLPPMVVERVGCGAGSRDLDEVPNLLRLVLGHPVAGSPADGDQATGASAGVAVLLETNVDDLDPGLRRDLLELLIDAGAADAWLTPILTTTGRMAHTVHALCAEDRTVAVRAAIFSGTSTGGLRELRVGRTALDRA